RLRELLAVRVDDEARDRRVCERERVELVVAADDRREQPRADDLVRLRAEVHRKDRPNRSGSSTQLPAICGVNDDVAHVSITSGSPVKPPGLSLWSAS